MHNAILHQCAGCGRHIGSIKGSLALVAVIQMTKADVAEM